MKEEESASRSLASVRTLAPFMKTESHLVWPTRRAVLRGIFGLPPGVVVERVKIGAFSFAETGAYGKSVFPGQPLVVVLENMTTEPKSLVGSFLAVETSLPQSAIKSPREEPPEPRARKGSVLLPYTLLFGGGQARVGFRVQDLSTFEEIWTSGCSLDSVRILGTVFQASSLFEWRGMVLSPGATVELAFVPKGSASRARAVVRLEKLAFPRAEERTET